MKALDVYFPRNADLAHVLALLAPAPAPDGARPSLGPASGVLLTAAPGSGLTSFLLTELMHAPYLRRHPTEFASPEAYGLDGDPRAVSELLAVADEAAAIEGPAFLVVDQLHQLPAHSQADLVARIDRGARANPQLQYVLGLAGDLTPELAAALESCASLARLPLPPLGTAYTSGLALYLAEDESLVFDPAALDAVFRAAGYQPARLKAAIREMVHSGHPDLATAAAAVGIAIPEAV